MKTGILSLLFLLATNTCLFAFAPLVVTATSEYASMQGTVLDAKTKLPLQGAAVTIPDLKLATVTDSLGKFRFNKLPSGTFLVEVKFQGYKSITKTIVFKNQLYFGNFELEESATEINEVCLLYTSPSPRD